MSKRSQGSAGESLAEALSRVMITREEQEHRESFDWATQEGRGDRMPRFLERAIEDVPHAARTTRANSGSRRYQGRSRIARASFLMSVIGAGVGIGVSFASPSSVAPLLDKAQRFVRTASANFTFTSDANAAMPRLAFGEALRNYAEQAAAQSSRANIVVSNLSPGATLSAGEQVSATEWSLPQRDLDNLVITFPTGASAAAMHATVEIPGNSPASNGKFSVELRQAVPELSNEGTTEAAPDSQPVAAEAPETPAAATPAASDDKSSDDDDNARKSKATSSGDTKAVKRKSRPSASLTQKAPTVASAVVAPKPSTTTSKSSTVSVASSGSSETKPSLLGLGGLFTSLGTSGTSPNALTMFSLGGPTTE